MGGAVSLCPRKAAAAAAVADEICAFWARERARIQAAES